MTDIVERLRRDGRVYTHMEAADEIERLRATLREIAADCEDALAMLSALRAERDRLREALQWFVDNDDTNEGDEPMPEYGGRSWNEINAYWIDGLNRARAALKETGHD